MSEDVLRYVAFSDRPDGGNPAGVVLEADVIGASLEDPAVWRALGLEARVT